MSCNCKKKPRPFVEYELAMDIITRTLVDNEPRSINEQNTMINFYNQIKAKDVTITCNLCFEDYIIRELTEYYNIKNNG